jgi:homopolymeric O-antigen transport system ATP-binding protein
LVSHSMPAIQALCRRILWIQEGALREDADNETVISRYLASGLDAHTVDTERPEIDLSNYVRRSHSQERALQKAWVLDRNGVKNNSILMGDSLTVYYQFRCSRAIRNPVFGFALEDEYHRRILTLDNYIAANEKNVLSVAEAGIACLHIPKMPLLAGKYFITLSLVEDQHEWIDRVERALVLHVHPADVYRSGRIPEPQTQGVVFVAGEISVQSSNGLDHPALA